VLSVIGFPSCKVAIGVCATRGQGLCSVLAELEIAFHYKQAYHYTSFRPHQLRFGTVHLTLVEIAFIDREMCTVIVADLSSFLYLTCIQ
jgi:hypothetical protein